MNQEVLDIRLELQTALLGEVIPQLICVYFLLDHNDVKVVFRLDRDVSAEERDDLDAVTTELMSHHPDKKIVSVFKKGEDFEKYEEGAVPVYARKRIDKYRVPNFSA